MGGASRNDKRRRQDAAAQRLSAAGITVPPKQGPNRTVIIVAAVLAVVLVAGVGVWYFRSSGTSAAAPTYTASQSGAVVTVGSGKTVVDVYEDYLCPICERFEQRYGAELTTALNADQITVRYHGIAILDDRSTPKGYSTRAANAALCSVPAGIFPGYHQKLYDSQPAEGSAGLTNEQLIAFGTDLKAQGDFASCVNGSTNAAKVTAETDKATSDAALQTDGQFGTPTVAIGGKKIDLNNSTWLQDAIKG